MAQELTLWHCWYQLAILFQQSDRHDTICNISVKPFDLCVLLIWPIDTDNTLRAMTENAWQFFNVGDWNKKASKNVE